MKSRKIKTFKLAFFDLDGTLLNSKGIVSESSKKAVNFLRDSRIHIALATGRSSFGSQITVDYLDIDDFCIFFSGSLVINPRTKEVLFESFLSSADLLIMTKICRNSGIYQELYTADDFFIEKNHPLADMHAEYMGKYPGIVDFDLLIGQEKILKSTLVVSGIAQEKAFAEMKERLSTRNFGIAPGATAPDVFFANITNSEASRENAFKIVTEHYGVKPEETIAFGDSTSDIPFLKMSGLGIALGNAPTQVQAVADYVTLSVDEEGISAAIDALFKED